jgi:putative transferase (TIGR04331 family)
MPDTERLLITTADERTWRNDRPVLFLGEWCRPYSLRAAWSRMDATVVPPYGWRDGQQDADYAQVQRLYELLLGELSDELNRYHGTTFSRRYWRILIGPWLNTFVAIVFNRWATIQQAL